MSEEKKARKKNGNVPAAETKPPENDSSVAATEDVSTDQAEASDVEPMPEFTLIEIPKLSKDQIKAAKTFNIPLDKLFGAINTINAYANTIETRFKIIAEDIATTPQRVIDGLKEEGRKVQEERRKQLQKTGVPPQQGGQGGGAGEQFMSWLLQGGGGGGGGGMDSEMANLNKELMKASIEGIKQNIKNSATRAETDRSLTEAIKKAVTAKIAGKAMSQVLEE